MKLNPDCIRDILLITEELERYLISENSIPELLTAYPLAEIIYHAKQCEQSGYFSSSKVYINNSMNIEGLSPEGHLMLQYIRDHTGFNKVKKLLLQKGLPFTLNAIKSILECLS